MPTASLSPSVSSGKFKALGKAPRLNSIGERTSRRVCFLSNRAALAVTAVLSGMKQGRCSPGVKNTHSPSVPSAIAVSLLAMKAKNGPTLDPLMLCPIRAISLPDFKLTLKALPLPLPVAV